MFVLLSLPFSRYMMIAAVILTVVSGLEYLIRIRGMTGSKIVNLPNLITISRLLLVIPFAYYMLNLQINTSLIFFAVIALSDKLDGISARLMRQITEAGSFLDSLTDWVFVTVTIVVFAYTKRISWAECAALLALSLIAAAIKLAYLKRHRKLLISVMSKITVGFGYITILAIMISFVYKEIFVTISLLLLFITNVVFLLKSAQKSR